MIQPTPGFLVGKIIDRREVEQDRGLFEKVIGKGKKTK